MRTNRIGLPKELLDMKDRDDTSSIHVMDETRKYLLISYVVKKRITQKKFFILSTMLKYVKVTRDIRKKPNVIAFYDRTKRGLDVMNMTSGGLLQKSKAKDGH